MNRFRIFHLSFCLLCVTIPAFADDPNLGARNPTTPTYGISNYFELTPEKANPVRKKGNAIKAENRLIRAFIKGTTLFIRYQGIPYVKDLTLSVHSSSGRRICSVPVKCPDGAGVVRLPSLLPSGVYFAAFSARQMKRRVVPVALIR